MFKKLLPLLFLFAGFQVNAALVVGDTYGDADGQLWEFIGSWQVYDGPAWAPSTVLMLNGLEAAEHIFGALDLGSRYAISSLDSGFVNHLTWYDGWGQPCIWDGCLLAEDVVADVYGDGLYGDNGNGGQDLSAYVFDHYVPAVNFAFVSVAVPEPTIIALFALGLFGIGFARRRQS
ncbi:MAG: hypothetical protein ACJAS1_005769 [Oleiphilaceae bacterium]|jgi:hypothetical protein